MTDGQALALRQLQDVASFAAGALEIISWTDTPDGGDLKVDISIHTGHLPRTENGLPLRQRERFVVCIPDIFPFRPPSVWTGHTRFAGFPHVQWGRFLCLYQSIATEWDPADGSYGLLTRLEEWLAQGARGELDPLGAPLHPPAVYAQGDCMFIPRADVPQMSAETDWFGLARLRVVSERRIDIVGWSSLPGAGAESPVAAAVLLSSTMPWEYPTTVASLIQLLSERGVSRSQLLLTLQSAVVRNPEGEPLHVVVGAPMRGIRGSDLTRQHLSVWTVERTLATALRLSVEQYSDVAELQDIGDEAEAIVWKWAQRATATWCPVREERKEIVTRRDHDAPAAWFRGRRVTLWGCGAVGSFVAEQLVRAGVKTLIVYDNSDVAPGLLVRQQFEDADIGAAKVSAVESRLRKIRPDVEVIVRRKDLVRSLTASYVWENSDLVIDSTGSRTVLKLAEKKWSKPVQDRTSFASLVVGPRAERGLSVVVLSTNSGGPLDAVRRAKLAACGSPALRAFRDEFWPAKSATGKSFQPEPGCSDPTFVGSAADMAVLSASMLNLVARNMIDTQHNNCFAHFVTRPDVPIEDGQQGIWQRGWPAERSVVDRIHNYQVRFSDEAWQGITRAIEAARRRRGRFVETGGLLLGERDDAAGVIWVTDATDPPDDSAASRGGFICGIEGTAELDVRRRSETLGSVRFLGMWHTHPDAPPLPSGIDLQGMKHLVSVREPPIAQALMVIVGFTPINPTPAAYVFRREDFGNLSSYPSVGASVGPWKRMMKRIKRLSKPFISSGLR